MSLLKGSESWASLGSSTTHSSISSSNSTFSSSANSPSHHSLVLDNDALKTAPQDDVVEAQISIKCTSVFRIVGPVAQQAIQQQALVVDLDSSTTLSDQGIAHPIEGRVSLYKEPNTSFPFSNEQPVPPTATIREAIPEGVILQKKGKAIAVEPSLPTYDGRYLDIPYTIPPNFDVSGETLWNARKFHCHPVKQMLSKKMCAQYTPLKDPLAAFAQSAKHITEALIGAYVLAKLVDHLARKRWVANVPHLFCDNYKDEVPGLVDLFNIAKDIHPDWFDQLSVDAPPMDKPLGEKGGEEDAELPGESRSPPA
ncbi:hypothetical protein LIER_34080 [Lithospermum erythrorhizon]|uniref:Uncharacterized protein n=1 Tax=Lithospermum erythrorhizon TaxID=34254 RepID=A0AAV3S2D8_LITER